jgi:flagellar biosynthesis protein FliQ
MKNLIIGDLIVLLAITLIGFATHNEFGIDYLPRMVALFLPLALAWFLTAWLADLFSDKYSKNYNQLYRPFLAMMLAAPLAILLRALILNTPIITIFALVTMGTNGIALTLWRAICVWKIKNN